MTCSGLKVIEALVPFGNVCAVCVDSLKCYHLIVYFIMSPYSFFFASGNYAIFFPSVIKHASACMKMLFFITSLIKKAIYVMPFALIRISNKNFIHIMPIIRY